MIEINIDGFYHDPKDLPKITGIYVVFACRYSEIFDSIQSARIIYIGQADNIQERHYKGNLYCHEHLEDFRKECGKEETVFYGYAPMRSLDKVENALIAMQQPPVNSSEKNSYNHTKDYFRIYGAGADDFKLSEFGFSKDYDINSLYTRGEIEFE